MDFINDSLTDIKKNLQKATITALAAGSNVKGKFIISQQHSQLNTALRTLATDVNAIMTQSDTAISGKAGKAEAQAVNKLSARLSGMGGAVQPGTQSGSLPNQGILPY